MIRNLTFLRSLTVMAFGVFCLFAFNTSKAQITLGSSPYTQDFNSIGSGLPTGWTVRTGATASNLGTTQTLVTANTVWSNTTGQFQNSASANPPATSSDNTTTQNNNTDRALSVRQTGSFGDPGAAFVLQIANTLGYNSFSLSFDLMSLDGSGTGRTTTWLVDYGFGTTPSSFTTATTSPATLTTSKGTWGTTTVTVNFGSALDNYNGSVWIRIVALSSSSGSGSRPVTGIDDFSLSYSSSPVPNLSVGTLSNQFGNVCINTTSSYESFTVSGTDLDGSSVDVSALSGFTYCLTSGGTYTSTLNLPYTAPTLGSTTVYVKFNPTLVQSYAGNIAVTGGGASTENCVVSSANGVNSAPTTNSGSSSSITQNSATVAGTIPDIGCSSLIDYGIEYSTTMGFANGSGTPVSSTNLSGIDFSSALSGLTLGTTYYYHAYATNSGGTSYGAEQSFTTLNIDAPVATAATNIGIHSFRANWNAVSGATGYFLDVSTSPTFIAPISTDIAYWDFPNNPDDATADGGSVANLSATITTEGGVNAPTFDVAGATTEAATATGWDGGMGTKYWQVIVNTQNYFDLTVSSKQRSSNKGPRDFKLQYKIGAGGTWTDVSGATVTVANDFTSGVLSNVALPAECDNQSSVYLRWIMTSNTSVNNSTVTNAGTSRMDDLFVTGYEGDYVVYNQSESGLFSDITGLNASTTYYYRVRATDGTHTSDNSNVINLTTLGVCDLLAVSAGSNSPVCANATLNLTSNGTGSDGTITGYQWSGPGGYTSSVQNPSVSNPVAGTYTVTVTDDNGCTADNTTNVIVNPLPSQPDPITGAPTSVCPNPTDGPYTLSTSATNATSYHWYLSPGTTGVNFLTADGSNSIDVEFGTTVNSTYVIRVEASNSCGTSAYRSVMVRRTVSTPASVIGNAVACANTNNVAYSCTPVSGADSYEWTISGDATVTGTTENVTVNFGPAWTGGTLCVAAKVGCFTSSTKCMNISSSVSAAAIGAITGTFTACPNAVQTYSVANISGATYNWTTPSNSNITQGAGTNSVEVTFQNNYNNIGNICVTVVSGCGVSTGPKCKTIAPSVPKRPVSITGTSSGLCNGNVNYSVAPQAGMNFQWTTPGTIIGPNNTETINVQYGAFTTGQVCVSAYNACGTSPSRCMIVKGAPIAAASITPGLACANQNVTFTADTTNIQGDFTLTWMYPNTATYVSGGGNTNDITVTWGAAAGNVILMSSNACGSASRVKAVALDNCRFGEENSQPSAFSVYPNPADNYITIEWNATEQGTTHIVLTDITGKMLKQDVVNNNTGINIVSMDVSMLPKGIYMLSAINNNGVMNKRVVIE